MAQTILIKRSSSTAAPTTLSNGELAYSSNSNKLWIGNPGGAAGDVYAIGGKYYTDIIAGAASANTVSKLVLRDGSGNFSAGTITATLTGNVTGALTGNADTATTLATSRNIGGVAFNGSAAINLPGVNASGNQDTSGNAATVTNGVYTTGAQTIAGAKTFSSSILGNLTGNVTGNTSGSSGSTTGNAATVTNGVYTTGAQTIAGVKTFSSAILADLTGDVTGNVTGNVSGSAGTATGLAGSATVLATARSIGGLSFDGSADIVLPGVNAAGTQATSGLAAEATILATGRTVAITGDMAYTSAAFDGSGNVTGAGTLATVNSTVGAFGSTTAVPVVTVNAKGLVTSVTTEAIATSWNLDADTGTTNAIAGGETLTVAGGTGVATVVSGNTVTASIGQAVATSSNVTFNNVAVDGTLTSDDITAANMTASGNVIVTGNLTVNGTTTTVNSTTVALGDAVITLNSGETGTPSANAGLEVERGTSVNASILWNETGNYWQTTDGETANVTSQILTAANFAATYTGNLDGGTF